MNRAFIRGVLVTMEKNIRIYYTKAPVVIFGLMFPLFLFLSFYLGRSVDMRVFFPGLLAMSFFFTSSSVGPLITPWEKQAGTYERLLSFPVSINTIIFGDILAGMVFGIVLSAVLLAAGLAVFRFDVNVLLLVAGIVLAAFCFAALGVLLASPATRSPSHIMMFSSLIRFPLIFISGVFIPLDQLHGAGRVLAYFSPITYLVDILRFCFGDRGRLSLFVDFGALLGFSLLFVFLANRFHHRNLLKAL